MALHPDFPDSPHAILDPEVRWFPADEALRENTMDKLMPPLVAQLRRKVKEFRDSGYVGASETSRSLLNWWFKEPHLLPKADGSMFDFRYYFAQREAIETIVYLYDVVGAKDRYDLMRFDASGAVSAGMFDESWRRYVIKMATGSGKTKVMSLASAWSFFHKLYDPDSELSRNFLVIAPNIIVLDRIYHDFQGLRIFFEDPVLPDAASRAKLAEKQSAKFTEKYADYLDLGVIEWRKAYEEHQKLGKKAILFVITDDTRNCDEVAEYLENRYPDFAGAVLTIHTKNNGEISEAASGKAKEENENTQKDIDALDIEIPVLTPRVYREYKNLADLEPGGFSFQPVAYRAFSEEEQREIVFKDITTGEVSHTTVLDSAGVADYRSVIGYFTQTIMKELRLVSGYDVLYGKVKGFVQNALFGKSVELESANTLRNLSELPATKTVIEAFKKAINDLTVRDKGDAEIRDVIKLRKTRPFVVKDQGYMIPKKSVFNRVIGDSRFELVFAMFLD